DRVDDVGKARCGGPLDTAASAAARLYSGGHVNSSNIIVRSIRGVVRRGAGRAAGVCRTFGPAQEPIDQEPIDAEPLDSEAGAIPPPREAGGGIGAARSVTDWPTLPGVGPNRTRRRQSCQTAACCAPPVPAADCPAVRTRPWSSCS